MHGLHLPEQLLIRMLLLSLSLHVAFLMIVQPVQIKEMAAPPKLSVNLETIQPSPPPSRQPPSLPAIQPAPPVIKTRDLLAPASSKPLETAQRPLPEPIAIPATAFAAPSLAPAPSVTMAQPSTTPSETKAQTASPPQPASRPTPLPGLPIAADLNWYSLRELDKPPRALSPLRPTYPALANSRGIEGSVKLRFRVDEFGRVENAEVLEGTPPGVFDAAALEALNTARFTPAQKNQRPVRALIEIRIGFKLED